MKKTNNNSDALINRHGVKIEDIKVGCVVFGLGVGKYGNGIEDRFLVVVKDQIVIGLRSFIKEKGKELEKNCEIYNGMHYVQKTEYYRIHIKNIKRILSALPRRQINNLIPTKETVQRITTKKKVVKNKVPPGNARKYKISKSKSTYGAFHMRYIPCNAYCKPYSGGDFR